MNQSSQKRLSARLAATHLLPQVLLQKKSLNTLLPKFMPRVDNDQHALLQELVYGTLRHFFALDALATLLLKRRPKKKDHDVYCLILLGLYQLRHMRTPPHAAIDNTVQVCRALRKKWATGLVNASLRNFQRQQAALEEKITANNSAQYSHPVWLIDALKLDWPTQYRDILQANNQHAPMVLRLNKQRTTTPEYLQQLETQHVTAQTVPHCDHAIQLDKAQSVNDLPGFTAGHFSVQDASAQQAAHLLQAQPGHRVLDACAAPGGKTCHLLEQNPNLHLTALDHSTERLEQVTENLQRLQLQATLMTADAGAPEEWWDGQLFDRILLDAPCSATGVIRRHPDIKLLRTTEDIHNLAQTQARLLNTLWPLLKQDGLLLYATCSILAEENSRVVVNFADHTSGVMLTDIRLPWGHAVPGGWQLLPGDNQADGFFYALLKKIAD